MARGTRLLDRPAEEIAVLLGHAVQRDTARLIELRTDPAGMATRIRNDPRDPFALPVEMPPTTGCWSTNNAATQVRGF